MMSGVFVGCGQTLTVAEFKRCVARCALGLVPDSDELTGDKL